MPISQSRVISILTAATDFEQAYDKLLLSVYELTQQPTLPTQQQIEDLYWVAKESVHNAANSKATLRIEREHFRKNARRNDYMAQKALEYRRKRGIGPREVKGPSFGQIAETYIKQPGPAEALPKPDLGFYTDWVKRDLAAQEALPKPSQGLPQFKENMSKTEALLLDQQLQEAEEDEGVFDPGEAEPEDP